MSTIANSAIKKMQEIGSTFMQEQSLDDLLYYSRIDMEDTSWRSLISRLGHRLITGTITPVVWDMEIWKASQNNYESFLGPEPPVRSFENSNQAFDIFSKNLKSHAHNDPDIQLWLFSSGDSLIDATESVWTSFESESYFQQNPIDSCEGFVVFPNNQNLLLRIVWQTIIVENGGFLTRTISTPKYAADCLGARVQAGLKYMALPFVAMECQRASHSTRKAFTRINQQCPDIRTVTLRRRQTSLRSEETSAGFKYSCQWLVGGHWRKLHEPRKADGAEITYVTPHLKGPEGKPFRAPRQTVYAVNR